MGEQDVAVSEEYEPEFYSAAIHYVRLAYGGPEEGGWWFDAGEPSNNPDHALLTRVFKNGTEAYEYAASTLRPVCDEGNKGRAPKHSVASSGVYEPVVQRGYPVAFPDKRPHYE